METALTGKEQHEQALVARSHHRDLDSRWVYVVLGGTRYRASAIGNRQSAGSGQGDDHRSPRRSFNDDL